MGSLQKNRIYTATNATVYRHLGIETGQTFPDFTGRPIPVLPTGRVIEKLV
jgi:hypothetical protein